MGLKQRYRVADREGSISLQWNLEVIKEMEGKLTGMQRDTPVVDRGVCVWWGSRGKNLKVRVK